MTRAQVYKMARKAFGAGTTLHEHADSVAILRPDPARRSRYDTALLVVARGATWQDAAERAGLVTPSPK